MKFTIDWLKQHLDTDLNDKEIINNLTNVGLEVESFENAPSELDDFIVAKILNAQQHPNADRLRVCDVDIGKSETVKVVCGAPNAKKGLFTVYAGPGAIIPKNQMKLSISKIRGVTSYGMLCSEAELKLSDESEGITELSEKYKEKIGKKYFDTKTPKVVDLSITPNRPDCLGVRGIARDLAAAGVGSLKKIKDSKLNQNFDQDLKVTIKKEWLKDKIISLGQKPISAIVDITNYVMIDLNRPLHAYDADKVSKEIIVRNSKKGETFEALDNKKYSLDDDMCVISDHSGVLGLGGIIGGTRSGTELETKNILLESAYFLPRSIRKTSKLLNIDTDAKFRFERGIDPKSIEAGLIKAADLIKEVCGGEVSKFDIQRLEEEKTNKVKFEISLFEKITGFKIEKKEIIKIISNLGFKINENNENLDLEIPSWRPDITQPIDIVEEIVRIKGYEHIQTLIPEKSRLKPTLNRQQKLFHFLQRSVASKGFYETVTWSFTDSKINNLFREKYNEIKIVNPISSELNVLRNSIFPNLVFYLKKNIDRGFKDLSFFEIGPVFSGTKPGEQLTVIGALQAGKYFRLNWQETERNVDVFDAKRDTVQTIVEAGFNKNKLIIKDQAPSYYHPGKSGSVFLSTEEDKKKKLKDQKSQFEYSDYQKSERDFAFVIDKKIKAQDLIDIIVSIDKDLIKNVKVFDVYEGENIPKDKKSIALNVTVQSSEKTLDEKDLEKINNLIISSVESKSGAKIRS